MATICKAKYGAAEAAPATSCDASCAGFSGTGLKWARVKMNGKSLLRRP
jgi:hypothetical protein